MDVETLKSLVARFLNAEEALTTIRKKSGRGMLGDGTITYLQTNLEAIYSIIYGTYGCADVPLSDIMNRYEESLPEDDLDIRGELLTRRCRAANALCEILDIYEKVLESEKAFIVEQIKSALEEGGKDKECEQKKKRT